MCWARITETFPTMSCEVGEAEDRNEEQERDLFKAPTGDRQRQRPLCQVLLTDI